MFTARSVTARCGARTARNTGTTPSAERGNHEAETNAEYKRQGEPLDQHLGIAAMRSWGDNKDVARFVDCGVLRRRPLGAAAGEKEGEAMTVFPIPSAEFDNHVRQCAYLGYKLSTYAAAVRQDNNTTPYLNELFEKIEQLQSQFNIILASEAAYHGRSSEYADAPKKRKGKR